MMDREILAQCEEIIGYTFDDLKLLEQALTHASAKDLENTGNERLEFLGDAILGMIVSEDIFRRFPDRQEGELTRIKSAVVSRATLASRLQTLGLTAFIHIGKGLAMKTRIPSSVLANVYEAVVAAIYIDGGLEPAREFCLATLEPIISQVGVGGAVRNYKSILQQFAQRKLGQTPQYRTLKIHGPAHGKSFQIVAVIGDQRYRPAWGKSKKDAEQLAASNALDELRTRFGDDQTFENWDTISE